STGSVLASAGNRVEELRDPIAHAEMLVLRAAAARQGAPRLGDCDLYVTLEPCPMCATAMSFARVRRLYFGASDPKGGGVEHGPRIFSQPTCHHRPEVYGGIDGERAGRLLKRFFEARREPRRGFRNPMRGLYSLTSRPYTICHPPFGRPRGGRGVPWFAEAPTR